MLVAAGRIAADRAFGSRRHLGEALAFVLAEKIAALAEQGQGRSALAAIDLFAAACRAGLGKEAVAIQSLIEEQVIEDPELGSVVAALTDLLLLRRGRETLGIEETGPLDHLVQAAWRRLLVLLPELADSAPSRSDRRSRPWPACAARSNWRDPRRRRSIWRCSTRRSTGFPPGSLPPMLAGAVMAFAQLDGRVEVAALEARLKGELGSGYVDPAERLAFLAGVIAIARELIWTVPAIIDTIDGIVSALDEDEFVALLPYLRLALMPLDPREVDRLAEEVAVRLGVKAGSLAVSVAIPEAELNENLRLDRELAAVLARDFAA